MACRAELKGKCPYRRFFWREIFKSGHVTDVFMTPRWEKSKGAVDEYKTAQKIGLTIHYLQEGI